jgi:hypothetical protein
LQRRAIRQGGSGDKERADGRPHGPGDVLLVYLPATQAGEEPRALGLAGAFEPGSEWVNPYSLLVAPAVAADTAIITAVTLLFICAHGGCR